ncbi:MAG: hypothetical protein WCN81_03185 [Actinomycetes bacterium]
MAKVHARYPLANIVIYNGVTLAHFGLGAAGIVLGYARWPTAAWTIGLVYLVFALGQMYVLMPLSVCPSCVYRRLEGARCVSAMNLVSARIAPLADEGDFGRRAEGALCHNHLYMASLVAPLVIILPALVFAFSWALLALLLAVAALLALRLFVVFPRVACGVCAAKGRCPNTKAMGIG